MDGVIAAAMENAKKRASTSGTTTDVSENLTPPPQNKSESTVRKPRLTDASSLEAASSKTLLDTTAPAPATVDSDSVVARTKGGIGKPRAGALPFLKGSHSSPPASNVYHSLYGSSPALPPLLKNGDNSSQPTESRLKHPSMSSPVPATAPPPNQKAIRKPLPTKTPPEERPESTSEDEDSATPKKKPGPVSDPDDELDAFLHAPAHPSQRSVLDELPSDSEDEEEEVEREDMEVDEEDEVPKSKRSGHGQLKVAVRTGSSSDDDSDSVSVVSDALVKANQVGRTSCVCCVKLTIGI